MLLSNNSAKMFSKVLLIIGFASAITSSISVDDFLWEDCYYHFMELAFVFYLAHSYLCVSHGILYSKKWQTIALFVLLCAISTLMDEIFYDATKLEINDIIRLLTVLMLSISLKYKFDYERFN